MRPMKTRPASLASGMSTATSPSRNLVSTVIALFQRKVPVLDHIRPSRAIRFDEPGDLGRALRALYRIADFPKRRTKRFVVQGPVEASLENSRNIFGHFGRHRNREPDADEIIGEAAFGNGRHIRQFGTSLRRTYAERSQ